MALKTFNPTSPGRRALVLVDRSELHKGRPEKTLVEGLTGKGGRSNNGRITVRFRGGGVKKLYRVVDFKRRKFDVPGVIERLEYDPNRSAWIALVKYADGELAYILAPQRVKAGDEVIAGERVDVKPGNAMPLRAIPVGTIIHNVELKPLKGGQMARSAGAFAQLMAREGDWATLRLPSGEMRRVLLDCRATIGQIGNTEHANIQWGKAGRMRWRGIRPHNRGVSMNPVDHPMGGGEGRSSGGRHPCTPWGQKTKGLKTRHNKRTEQFIIRRRK